MRPITSRLSVALVCLGIACAAAAADAPAEKDPIRAVLMQSKEKQRGVAIHVGGQVVNAIVTEIDDKHVIGRSQTSNRIVVRIERIDAVAAMF